MQNLRIYWIGEFNINKNYNIDYHSHDYNELAYYTSGNGKTTIDGKTFSFSKDTFMIVPPDIQHNKIHHSDCVVICLRFYSDNHIPLVVSSNPTHSVFKILTDIMTEIREQKYGFKDMLNIKLQELLLNINRIENTNRCGKNFEYIINYLQDNFHERIILSDCAKALNISYDFFQHKFKELTGFSPQQYLIEQRLLASEKMLIESYCNCTEIAYNCGFCTSAQFSASFKNKYGISPLKFRKANSLTKPRKS